MSLISAPVLPSIGDLCIPDAIDFNIHNNAIQPYFTFSDHTKPNGVRVITHLEFGRAAHRIAHILRPNRLGPDGQVVAIVALSDNILYQAIVAGCFIAGLVPFPISPRNSPDAVASLLKQTSCRRLLATTVTLKILIEDLRSRVGSSLLQVEEVPSLRTVFPYLGEEQEGHSFVRFPGPSEPISKDDICLYIHSSGSTGFPKAIPQTHLALMQWSSFPIVVNYRDYRPRLTMGCMALPAFHTFGFYTQILNPIYGIVSIAVYPPTATEPHLLPVAQSPESFLEHLKLTRSTAMLATPSMLQTLALSPAAVDYMATLEFVGYGGGSFVPKLGNFLVDRGVLLHTLYGATECGVPGFTSLQRGQEKYWEYLRFPDCTKLRWMPQGDGTFECQVLAWKKHRPMVLNLPDVEGYATSDLFVKHPTEKDLWRIVGRKDDVIVHSSGEKTVPAPMEAVIMSCPFVQGALLFGREHNEAGVLIEPTAGSTIDVKDHTQLASLRNKIWAVIEEANKIAPAFSRIFKEMILITSETKPLPRTGKGTIMRRAALELYDQEIVALYNTVESNLTTAENIDPPVQWVLGDVQAWLIEQASDLVSGGKVLPSVDLFEQGFDSLNATFLRLRIISALRASKSKSVQIATQELSQNLIYSHPIIEDLAEHIVALFLPSDEAQSGAIASRSALIEEMIAKYSIGLDDSPSKKGVSRTAPAVVLLTGTTGNLGSEILAALLQDDRVQHVYAFNRPSQATLTVEQRQLNGFKERGFSPDLLESSKLSFISSDAAQPNLGLDPEHYKRLSDSTNIVIHNAWKLDFNLSLLAFEPMIRGSRYLMDLVRNGRNAADARFLFTSSIGCSQSWPPSKGPYPEEIVADASFAIGGGYGESKYATERILAQSGLQGTSFRIGQVSGGRPNGAWAITNWVPILVKSSVTIGILPDLKGMISWIPMDTVAAAIVDAALGNEPLPQAANLLHPRPVEGKKVIESIQASIADILGRKLEVVSFAEWLATIEEHARSPTPQTLADVPAIKLMDFFRALSLGNDDILESKAYEREIGGFASFSTTKMLQLGHSIMTQLRSIGREDASLWVRYWKEVGYLH